MRCFLACFVALTAACGREPYPLPARPVAKPHEPACTYYQLPGASAIISTKDRCVYPGLEFEISDPPASYEFLDGKPGVEPVAGIGDKALWDGDSKQLALMAGGKDIRIRASDKETALSVAREITGRCCR